MSFPIQYTKIVQSGNLLEIYDYEKEPSPKRFGVRKKKRNIYKVRRSARNIQRAKNNFRRMVRASLVRGAPHFATLTMASVETITTAYKYFSKFTTNLRFAYGVDVAWVAVPEFQKRGAVHFHALIWGIPDEVYLRERSTRDLQALWACGFCDFLASDGSPKISSYMAKYMSKTMSDDRLSGKKSYTASRNIVRSVLCNTPTQIAYIEEEYPQLRDVNKDVDKVEVDKVYSTQWLGRCHYRKIVI